jgi:hypothetical protein
MSKVKVAAFSISPDGFGAGLHRSLENCLGVGGKQLHERMYPTNCFNIRSEKGMVQKG